MKKIMKTRIAAAAMALIMVAALSATAFADGPQGSLKMGGNGPMNSDPQAGMQMPQGGYDQGAQQGGFGQDQQMSGGPQMGRFDQNEPINGQQPPEKPEGDEDRTPPADGQQAPEKPESDEGRTPPADGQQPPEKPEGDEDRTPPADGQQPPEKPEGDEDSTPPADGQQPPENLNGENMTPPEKPEEESLPKDNQGMFRLFQQFLEWLKGNNAE